MNRDDEAIREFKEECEQDMKEDQRQEELMLTDLDFALEQLGLTEDTTIAELREITLKLVEYGWNTSAEQLLGEI